MISSIVVIAVAFAALGLLLGYAASYDVPSQDNRVLQLITERSEYGKGETVTFTATNTGSQTLVFPGSALGIEIENQETGSIYGLIGTTALTPIEPGQSKQIVWQDTAEVDAGNYVATIRTIDGEGLATMAEVSFRVS